jgi:hypothetical protein
LAKKFYLFLQGTIFLYSLLDDTNRMELLP